MHIETLQLHRFRNIDSAELEPSPGVNLIVGANAAGKTSLLEAIDFLSRGRSFRAYRPDELIQTGDESCRVVGRIRSDGDGPVSRLGIQRSRGVSVGRVDGVDITSLGELARRLAVVVLEPQSVALVSGAPGERRAFVDWGAFHQDPGFAGHWQRYRRLLNQRNSLLKHRGNTRTLDAIEAQMAVEGEALTEVREHYLAGLRGTVADLAAEILGDVGFSWVFRRGWSETTELSAALASHRASDIERGFTGVGPHRADLTFTFNGGSLSKLGSRGQQKSAVALLKLGQARVLAEEVGERAVLLLDDVASELDRAHRAGVLDAVAALNGQVFVTAIEEGMLDLAGAAGSKLFHVEHGRIQELV